MPQQHSRGGDDDGPPDETKTYHTEGEQEEKASENVVGPRDSFDHFDHDLNDVKSSLIDEGESVSQKGSSSQRNKRLGSGYGDHSKEDRHKKLHSATDGAKIDHIARFAPYGSLAFIANAGYHNGSMVGGPGITPKCAIPNVFPSPLRLGEGQKMPVLHPAGAYPPSLAHLMMYNQEHYPPGTPSPHLRGVEVDSKTGILRRRHSEISPYHPLSPGSLGSHHLEVYNMPWQGQHFYPLTSSALRSPYPASLAASPASMARLGPSPISSGPLPMGSLPHSLMNSIGTSQQHDAQQQSNDRHQKEKEKKMAAEQSKKTHIKKPLNAFMLYMKEMRASVVKECTLKESAAINQILGRRWHALSREEQAKYYELARKERQLHMQLYPGWSARDNYAIHGKKKKKKRDKTHGENSGEPSTPKKCRARFGVDQQEFWCKPCRRKKKCIRYISSDENDRDKNDDEDDDMEDDQSDTSPGQPPPMEGLSDHPPPPPPPPPPAPLSSLTTQPPPPRSQDPVLSPKPNGVHSRPLVHSNSAHSNGSQRNGEPPTSSSSSSKGPTPSSSSTLYSSSNSHKMQSHRDSNSNSIESRLNSGGGKLAETSRGLFSPHLQISSTCNSSVSSVLSQSSLSIPSLSSQHLAHHSQQPLGSQTSPTIVHLPHPAAASYPSLSSTAPPMVMFSPQASLIGHHAPPGMHDSFRPHIANGFAPHGLLPMPHPQGVPPPPLLSAHAQQLRLPSSEMPQDLSVKSGTVTA